MATHRPRGVIFDLDGTLIDSVVQITHALNILRARRGGSSIEKCQTRLWISLGAVPLVANTLGDLAGHSAGDVAEFRAIYGALSTDPADLFPYVAETLASFRENGFRMVICTAKPQDLARRVVEGASIAEYFEGIIGGRNGLPAKPDAAPVREALALLGPAANSVIYIGDSEVDAQAAKAAELPFLLATFGYPVGNVAEIECEAMFDDFRQLPELVARLGDVP